MTESEAKAIKWLKNVRDDAVVTLDHIQKDEPNVSPMLYTGRKRKAETIMEMCEELQQYRAIGTIEEFKDLKEYKAKMEMQYLDDINNPLEPLKLSSALQSEIFKYNYRKEHKPQDISPLDYTIMYALKHCLEEQTEETKET